MPLLLKHHNYIFLFFFIIGLADANAQQIAFPGAEGYGKYTIGGRGGRVIEVTNLNDSGTGSLRAAVEASGARTVVFRVSGTITLNSPIKISNPYITIAGQTAPGDGICIRKHPLAFDNARQVIVRYIRVRLGDETGIDYDAVSSRGASNVILDHVSASWSVDETMSVYFCDNITIQWCMISESMFNSNHIKGSHGFGGVWGSNYSTSHHNLLAHHSSRNPRMASGCGNFDFRNNVVYNWGYNSTYGGEQHQSGDANHQFANINMVANYYKPGPATTPGNTSIRIANPSYRDVKTDYGKWYISDNYMAGSHAVTADNWNGGVQPQGGSGDYSYLKLAEAWPAMAIDKQTAEEAYTSVLDNVGATLPRQDIVDARIIRDTRSGSATFEGLTYKQSKSVPDKSKICGIIDSQKDVGGWPELKSASAPADSDHDGMPDDWENARGLNPTNPDDGKIVGPDGYTNLEKYLNGIEFQYPVSEYKLTSLSATGYQLEWADSYLAEDGFRVERSDNNGEFKVIANLPRYSNKYTDNNAPSGKVSYRVVAYNSDNSTPPGEGISNTTTVVHNLFTDENELTINCFPNPFSDELSFVLSTPREQKVNIELYDLYNRKIATIASRRFVAGSHSIVWNCSNLQLNLKQGLYIVSVTTEHPNTKQQVKLIKK